MIPRAMIRACGCRRLNGGRFSFVSERLEKFWAACDKVRQVPE